MNYLLSDEALPPEIKAQLTRITESWKTHAGESLVGVYLHGSVALGAFQPASGDLDVLVVVKDALRSKRSSKSHKICSKSTAVRAPWSSLP